MRIKNGFGKLLACSLLLGLSSLVSAQGQIQVQVSLQQAVALAQEHDPWLTGSRYREQATRAQSVAAGQLPDPMVSLGFANLPVDSFDFGQEPMTQLKVGVSQAFPRGDTRELKRQQLSEISAQHPYMRQDRQAKVAVAVSQLWLDSYRSKEAIRLIEQNRALFEHLVDVAESSYTSGLGKTRQQDLLRAQLELTRLDDRLAVLQQQQEMSHAKLGEWLSAGLANDFVLSDDLPTLVLVDVPGANTLHATTEQLVPVLLAHPMIKGLDQQIVATATNVQLAKQKYKPQWGVNASYGYRDDDPMGNERSDFFSLGVTFDVPIFTSNRQDKDVQAAVATEGAVRTDKALALRSIRARFETARARLQRLNQRKALYQNRLLQEIHDQAEASITAYTNDDGDFAEVVRARIAELNANIDFLTINIDQLKTIAELNYFFAPATAGRQQGFAP